MKLSSFRKFFRFSRIPVTKWQIKLIFALFAFGFIFAVILFTQSLVDELINREQKIIKFYADVYKHYLDPNANFEDMYFFIDEVTPSIHFPMISTDENGVPNFPYEQYTLNVDIDTTLPLEKQKKYLEGIVKEMEKNYPPIIVADKDGKIITKFYYNHSPLIDKLRLFPLYAIMIITGFIILGYLTLNTFRRNEESKVWVGMAREAAHQLGTPLSSLLAWLEILKFNKDDSIQFTDTLMEMEDDLTRLNTIATRFSKIGSMPEMKKENLSMIIENVCQYFERRLPHLGKRIEIIRNLEEVIMIDLNRDLFAWVIENLLKNGAESIEEKTGKIFIYLRTNPGKKVFIYIKDTGKGMSSQLKRQIFQPGFTTKKRGWGLGLSLCKRIVQQYHGGKIYVKDSIINQGTVFAIELPYNVNK